VTDASLIVGILCEDLNTRRERAAFVAKLRNKHRLKFRQIGRQLNVSPQRAHKIFHGYSAMEAVDLGAIPGNANEAMQKVTEFLNREGYRGQFKMWPEGTYTVENLGAFTMTTTSFMGDAWEEQWQAFKKLDLFLEGMGYSTEVSGNPGQPRTFRFFRK
jgi:hypothetical protein